MSDQTRRERKKQQTRDAVREAAWELFAALGYEATTIQAIADAADVAPRTVTMHFPAKEDLVFSDDDPFHPRLLKEWMQNRPAGQAALTALREWMHETIGHIESANDRGRYWRARALRARLIGADDKLRGRARASYLPSERIIAGAIGQDRDINGDSLMPRLVASSVVTGLRELYEAAEVREAGSEPRAADLLPLVDRVIDFAEAGMQRLEQAPDTEPTRQFKRNREGLSS